MRRLLPIATQTKDHLRNIRAFEAREVMALFGNSKDILEVGAGDGYQSSIFASSGYRVKAIDIPPSTNDPNYTSYSELRKHRYYTVDDYDGLHIPFNDMTFDIVYSSNVLEHIRDKSILLSEMKRVLRGSGSMIHVLPNARWRILSTATHFYKNLALMIPFEAPHRHGEIGSHLTEIYYFSDYWWTREFKRHGFSLTIKKHNRLFYSGECILDKKLSTKTRALLAKLFGSSCTIYQLKYAFEKQNFLSYI